MINIFIFYKDLNYINHLSNLILEKSGNIKLLGFDTNISDESINLCNELQPQIIITDEIFHQDLVYVLNFNYIYINIPQTDTLSTEKICNQINKFALDFKYTHKINLYNYRKNIFYKLQVLNFNANLCGTHYLLDYITYLHENPHYSISSKKLYIKIAEKYNVNIDSIIWNIHTCIDEMYKYTSNDFRKNIYGTTSKINLQSVIKAVADLY